MSRLDPEIRRFSTALRAGYAALQSPGMDSIEASRAIAEIVRRPWVDGGPVMARVLEAQVGDGAHPVRVRVYEPDAAHGGAALIYLHGGGWTLFSLDTHDRLMREYAARAEILVIGVDYSLAPEAKYPTQIEECLAVMRWVEGEGDAFGIAADRLVIGGDSAGANLALATCLKLRERAGAAPPAGMLLNYGTFDASGMDLPTVQDHPEFTLTRQEMESFWSNYLRGPEDRSDPLVSLCLANLEGLPSVCMVIAEQDILLTENLDMAKRFREAGVAVEAMVFKGATHSFLEAVSIAAVSDRALSRSSAWLAKRLRTARDC